MIFQEGLVTVMDNAFKGCTGMTSVTLPAGLEAIGAYAFKGCTGLTSVTLPAGLFIIERELSTDAPA